MSDEVCHFLTNFNISLSAIFLYLTIKSYNTVRQHRIIRSAICAYITVHLADRDVRALLDEMEPFKSTLYRWWDWGYKRIVPRDVYNQIEPYIGMEGPTEE